MLEILKPTTRKSDLNTFFASFNRAYPWTDYGTGNLFHRSSTIPIDVQDIGNSIVVRADVPGREKNELNVELKKNSLLIESGATTSDQNNEQFILKERPHRTFTRVVQLPSQVDTDNVTSSYKDGVLEIIMPKMEKDVSKKLTIE